MERVGHKLGYHMKDASGKYAPVVKVVPKDFSRREQGGDPAGSPAAAAAAVAAVAATAVVTVGGGTITVGQAGASVSSFITVNGAPLSPIESLERERGMGLDDAAFGGYDTVARPTRGFGVGYESLQDEYTTDVDVSRLVSDMKKEGIEVNDSHTHSHTHTLTHSRLILANLLLDGRRTLYLRLHVLLLPRRGRTRHQTLRRKAANATGALPPLPARKPAAVHGRSHRSPQEDRHLGLRRDFDPVLEGRSGRRCWCRF